MIVVKLMGGLGNQLFQYAFGKNIELANGEDLYFDTSSYIHNKDRKLSLLEFNVEFNTAEQDQIDSFFTLKNRFINKYAGNLKINSYRSYFEKTGDYHQIPNFNKRNAYYSGYWQSENYFKPIERLLKAKLVLKKLPKNIKIDSIINTRETVGLHIRRGDYASNTSIKSYFGLIPKTYYLNAASHLTSKIENPIFIIFSDDLEWVKVNFNFPFEHVIFDDTGYSDAESMVLMAKCRHHIIANSTFSWWVAWLNNNPNKQIITPNKWFANRPTPNGLIPNNWYKF